MRGEILNGFWNVFVSALYAYFDGFRNDILSGFFFKVYCKVCNVKNFFILNFIKAI